MRDKTDNVCTSTDDKITNAEFAKVAALCELLKYPIKFGTFEQYWTNYRRNNSFIPESIQLREYHIKPLYNKLHVIQGKLWHEQMRLFFKHLCMVLTEEIDIRKKLIGSKKQRK